MIPTETPHLTYAALSHPGEAREINEDRYSVVSYETEKDRVPALLALVADGIGGHQAGEVAAQIAIDEIVRVMAESEDEDPIAALRLAVVSAGRAISRTSAQDEALHGMGSTIAAAWIIGRRLYTCSVGDSRIYMLREKELRQISIDHTWVQETINHGIIKPEEARNHPNAHVLHRHLGGDKDPKPDFRLKLSQSESDEQSLSNQGMDLQAGDQLLLCSDGLTDLVEDRELRGALENSTAKSAISQLIELARARGGHDNITAVTVAVPDKSGRSAGRGCLGASMRMTIAVLVMLALIVAGLGFAYWSGLWPWDRTPVSPTPELAATVSIPVVEPEPATTTPSAVPSDTPSPTFTPSPSPSPEGPTSTPVG